MAVSRNFYACQFAGITRRLREFSGRLPDGIIDQIEFRRRDAIRRHDIDGIAQGAQQAAPFHGKTRVSSGPMPGQIAGIGHFQIQRGDGAQAADIRETRSSPRNGASRSSCRPPSAAMRSRTGSFFQISRLAQRRGAGDGIGGEGTGMKKGAAAVGGIMRVENLVASPAWRPAAALPPVRPLARQRMSGAMPACSQANRRAGAAKAGHHFIGDEQRAMAFADALHRGAAYPAA